MSYFRKQIELAEGYQPGEQPRGVARVIKLNTNENPFPPSPRVIEAIRAEADDTLRLYPSPKADRLRAQAAKLNGVSIDQVIAGNGSDDILTIVTRCFVGEGQRLGYPYPTYSLYGELALLQGAGVAEFEFPEDFQLPESIFGNDLPLVFVVNPNAPTGTLVPVESIRRLAKSMKGVLLVDEAYIDFAGKNVSAVPLLAECPNLIVSRTLSKSYALAGLRAGYALAGPEIIAGMMKVKDSYNVNRLTDAGAAAALADQAHLADCTKKVIELRALLTGELARLGFDVYPSRANFVLARTTEKIKPAGVSAGDLKGPLAQWIYEQLKSQGILVRYFQRRRLDDCLRITVGGIQEIEALVDGLGKHLIPVKICS